MNNFTRHIIPLFSQLKTKEGCIHFIIVFRKTNEQIKCKPYTLTKFKFLNRKDTNMQLYYNYTWVINKSNYLLIPPIYVQLLSPK